MNPLNEFVCVSLSDPAVDIDAISQDDREAYIEVFDRSLLMVKPGMKLMEFHCTPLKVREAAVAPNYMNKDDAQSYLIDVFLRHVKHISNLDPEFDKRTAMKDGKIREDWLDEGFIRPPMVAAAVATGVAAQIIRRSQMDDETAKN